jgi:putative ABC transport system substrate-binding protein
VSGILASIGPNYPTLGRLAADAAARVFHGTPAADVPFAGPPGIQIAINKATMTELRITVPAGLAAATGAGR